MLQRFVGLHCCAGTRFISVPSTCAGTTRTRICRWRPSRRTRACWASASRRPLMPTRRRAMCCWPRYHYCLVSHALSCHARGLLLLCLVCFDFVLLRNMLSEPHNQRADREHGIPSDSRPAAHGLLAVRHGAEDGDLREEQPVAGAVAERPSLAVLTHGACLDCALLDNEQGSRLWSPSAGARAVLERS